jgi:hypothetical protein
MLACSLQVRVRERMILNQRTRSLPRDVQRVKYFFCVRGSGIRCQGSGIRKNQRRESAGNILAPRNNAPRSPLLPLPGHPLPQSIGGEGTASHRASFVGAELPSIEHRTDHRPQTTTDYRLQTTKAALAATLTSDLLPLFSTADQLGDTPLLGGVKK